MEGHTVLQPGQKTWARWAVESLTPSLPDQGTLLGRRGHSLEEKGQVRASVTALPQSLPGPLGCPPFDSDSAYLQCWRGRRLVQVGPRPAAQSRKWHQLSPLPPSGGPGGRSAAGSQALPAAPCLGMGYQSALSPRCVLLSPLQGPTSVTLPCVLTSPLHRYCVGGG